jgi:hypothetical protein
LEVLGLELVAREPSAGMLLTNVVVIVHQSPSAASMALATKSWIRSLLVTQWTRMR